MHRDVKPANIIFSESSRKFKLIDLGACADLRSGTNYIPDESILDPMYCPPEQVCQARQYSGLRDYVCSRPMYCRLEQVRASLLEMSADHESQISSVVVEYGVGMELYRSLALPA